MRHAAGDTSMDVAGDSSMAKSGVPCMGVAAAAAGIVSGIGLGSSPCAAYLALSTDFASACRQTGVSTPWTLLAAQPWT